MVTNFPYMKNPPGLDPVTDGMRLMREYNRKMIERGMGLSRKDLKSRNMIDMRPVLSYPEIMNPEKGNALGYTDWQVPNPPSTPPEEPYGQAEKTLGKYMYLPPFPEGVLQLNKDRYFHFVIEDLEPESGSFGAMIRDYASIKTGWESGCVAWCEYAWDERQQILTYHVKKERRYAALYAVISQKELGWTNDEYALFRKIADQSAAAQKNHDVGAILATMFASCIKRINLELFLESKSKQERPKNTTPDKKPENKMGKKADDKSGNGRKNVRLVGKIQIKSDTPVRTPSSYGMRKSHVDAWERSGHVRHYKSGKTAYIRPSVCRRKGSDPNAVPAGANWKMKGRKS